MMRKSPARIWALAFIIVSLLTMSAVTSAPTAAAATAPTGEVGILISQRQCNVGETPRQIVLFLGIGGDDGIRCYGGVPGSIALPNLPVFEVFSGGYTGVLDCQGDLYFFSPNERPLVIDTCHELTILPACGCEPAATPMSPAATVGSASRSALASAT